jgi:hypothetical protein
MAGLGRKTFAALDVLTAAQVNGYLMDQSVMVFASSTARASAIATASAGMATYLTDVAQFQVYNGTAWTQISGSGGGPDFLLMGA